MNHRMKIVPAMLLLLLLLAGCVAPPPLQLQVVPPTPLASDLTNNSADRPCTAPVPDQEWVRNEPAGYCLRIPMGYEARLVEETGNIIILAPGTTEGHRERLFIEQEDAMGRTLEDATGQVLMTYSLPAGEIPMSTIEVAGVPAQVIGRLPGQDLNRRVIVVFNGRINQMTFVPDDPEMGEAYTEMEGLYAAVLDSFIFLAPTAPLGIPAPNSQGEPQPMQEALVWERQSLGNGGKTEECQRLVISPRGTASAGDCGEVGMENAPGPTQWTEIYERFAPFIYQSDGARLVFNGQGNIFHPSWQRALESWAATSYAEIVGGQVGATSRTAMSWWLGAAADKTSQDATQQCRHLVVLSHGYAYAHIAPCNGGESQIVAEGWLQTPEMEAFNSWLYVAAPTYVEDNYIDGRGEQELSQAQITEIDAWAEHVYQLLQTENVE